ncbi:MULTISPECIES: hypothetical protein [Parachlamydia]|uniref:Uncharacterized protein n=2 Tax=Parachlamydia acanthamoebae TaxID=83552 RepID=F8KWE0_PARAV|nr:hypothetical protein [Parachlamydia acanthamoebae]KIA76240.1 hypothetical protein DB43_AQ00460 [Parachlamydia acanthamoebae]CCB85338.1 putative uncharacterized protein [Parachlamydia acanthamoebae UV-7]
MDWKEFSQNPYMPKPLWIIQFKKEAVDLPLKYPPVDLLIPSPDPNSPDWVISEAKINQETLNSLVAIQKACKKIKKECTEELNKKIDQDNPEECAAKSKRLQAKVEVLQELMKQFQKILKQINTHSS